MRASSFRAIEMHVSAGAIVCTSASRWFTFVTIQHRADEGHARASGRCLNKIDCLLLDVGVIAEASEPMHIGFAAKPGHLALGVVAVRLLDGSNHLLARELAAKKLHRLPVAGGI